nr:choice-of-anchor D domain-containing protein [Bacteroidota bacterium]
MKKILFLFTAIAFFGSASFSQLQFFPDAVDFGQVTSGQSDTVEVVFTSEITQNITLSALTTPFSADPQSFFMDNDSVQIIMVVFQPQDLGIYQQTITATGDVFGETTLTLTGEGIEANIAVTPLSYDFGGVRLNSTDSTSFSISNTGTGDLLCDFEVNNQYFDLNKNTLIVPSGGQGSLTVYFTPEFLDSESAVLAIISNDPNNALVQIPLTGFGVNEISGSVSGVWHKDNSPYTFVGNVNVPYDDTLTIMPGVEINMGENDFRIFGKLVCNGLDGDSIRFNGTGVLQFSSQYPNDSIQYVVIDGDTTSSEGLFIETYGLKIGKSKILANQIENINNADTFYDNFEDGIWEDSWIKSDDGIIQINSGYVGYGMRISGDGCEATSLPIIVAKEGNLNISLMAKTISSGVGNVIFRWKRNSDNWTSFYYGTGQWDWEKIYVQTNEKFLPNDTLKIQISNSGYNHTTYIDNVEVGIGNFIIHISDTEIDLHSINQYVSVHDDSFSLALCGTNISLVENIETWFDNSSIFIQNSNIQHSGYNAIRTNGNESKFFADSLDISSVSGTALYTIGEKSDIEILNSRLSNIAGIAIKTNGNESNIYAEFLDISNVSGFALFSNGDNSIINLSNSYLSNLSSQAITTYGYESNVFVQNSIISNCLNIGIFTSKNSSDITVNNSVISNCSFDAIQSGGKYEIIYSTILNNGGMGAFVGNPDASSIFNSIICLNNGSFGNQIQSGIYQEYSKTAGDPKFADSLGHLLSNSPCVDAADPTDQDSLMPQGLGTVRADMGAYGGPGNWIWGGEPVPSGEPSITDIKDIPQDEGGYVLLQFEGSIFDYVHSGYNIDHYSFWRTSTLQKGDAAAAPQKPNGDTFGHNREFWEKLGDMSAQGFEEYGYSAETYGDSMPGQVIWTKFIVIAHADEYEQYWISEPDSAYSIDNLAPGIPQNLTGNLTFSNYR